MRELRTAVHHSCALRTRPDDALLFSTRAAIRTPPPLALGHTAHCLSYDAAGNRLERSDQLGYETYDYTYSGGNELTHITADDPPSGYTAGYLWDHNGNPESYWWSKGSDVTYGWDSRDMLVNYNDTAYYRYDGMASRVSTQESAGVTYYDWDGINVIQEKDSSNTVTDRQVHGYAPIASVGDIALMDKSGTPYVPVSDQVGTVWDVLDSGASKVNYYEYDAFGVSRGATEAVANRYRFGTKRLDADSDLYHFIARQYGAVVGIFVTRDPLSNGGLNPYRAFMGQPASKVDPQGLWCCDLCKKGKIQHCTISDVRTKPVDVSMSAMETGHELLHRLKLFEDFADALDLVGGAVQGVEEMAHSIAQWLAGKGYAALVSDTEHEGELDKLWDELKRIRFQVVVKVAWQTCEEGWCWNPGMDFVSPLGGILRWTKRYEWHDKSEWYVCDKINWYPDTYPATAYQPRSGTTIGIIDHTNGRKVSNAQFIRGIAECMAQAMMSKCK